MSQLSKTGQALDDALRAVVAAAPEAKRNALAQAVEDYAEARPRVFRDDVGKAGLHGTLFDTLIEASDARPLHDWKP